MSEIKTRRARVAVLVAELVELLVGNGAPQEVAGGPRYYTAESHLDARAAPAEARAARGARLG